MFLSWVAFTIALFSKETAVAIPFLLIIYYFIFSSKRRFEKEYLFIILLYAVSCICWFWLRSMAIGATSDQNRTVGLIPILSNLRTIPESLSKFFLLLGIAPIPGFSILKTLAGFGIIVLIIFLFFKNKKKFKREMIFCFLWFLILMLPPMLYKHPLIDYMDHRFFLPFIGILLFLLFIVPKKWFIKGELKRYWSIIVVIALLCPFTFIKSQSYADPMTFYDLAISQNSHSAIAFNNRGIIRSGKSDYEGAVGDYSRAIAIWAKYDQAYYNRGYVKLNNMNDNAGAIADFNTALSINSKFVSCYYSRGVAYLNSGNFKEATEDLKKYISFNPDYADAYNYLGQALGSTGNFREAIGNFNKAIEINPKYWGAYGNRAIAKYSVKDFAGAIDDCEKLIKLNPNDKRAIKLKAQAQQEIQKTSR